MKKFTIDSPCDGLKLSCLAIEPKTPAKGIVQFSHGMCEHKERYAPFMEFLSDNGFACVINDHRGHGESIKSPEDLGYMYDAGWKGLVQDTRAVTQWARTRWPGLKLTLFGHSMGSLVVRSYTKRYDDLIDGLFVCGCPSENPATGAGKILACLDGVIRGWKHRPAIMQAMSFGAYNKPFASEGWKSGWVCSNPEILKAYHSDPLCQYVFTANGWRNLMSLMQDCYSVKGWKMSNPSLPVHFISGACDPCRTDDTLIEKAAQKMRILGYPDVDLKLYPGMRHEILNETDKLIVWNDVLHNLAR